MKPISQADANRIIRSLHYSGKVVPNSQIHLGVFHGDRCGGAMQFGPPMRKDLMLPLVSGTKWDGMIELNRMAFADWLPRNSESRCIAYALRYLRRAVPSVQWVISFADATQCGDGAIYRASGFLLIGIKKNRGLLVTPSGAVVNRMTLHHWKVPSRVVSSYPALEGFQLRYIYFLDPAARGRLTVPVIPFARIAEVGASMYRGVRSADSGTAATNRKGRCDSDPDAP